MSCRGAKISIALAPSLAGTMFGALDYLTSYPWGCTEQTLSSFVPNLVVLRAMSQMGLAPTERLRALLQIRGVEPSTVTALASRHVSDGVGSSVGWLLLSALVA